MSRRRIKFGMIASLQAALAVTYRPGADTMNGKTSEAVRPDSAQLDPSTITRPDDALLVYYFIISLLAVVAFPIVFVPLFIRFKTMRYRFDESGVSMCWGFFFRREIYLTYGRLQDIHLTRNILERWMGLAKLPIQTASGSSGATMRIEGIRDPEPLRDFLYSRMRGAKGAADTEGAATELLRDIRDELRGLRADREAAK